MTAELTRAQQLRAHGRHEEAVATLLSHLSRRPEDPVAFLELAINRMKLDGQLGLALENARTATGLAPESAFPLSLQARILCLLDRPKEALPLADNALALDPESEDALNAKCLAFIGLSRWKDAESCARDALALDPDDETASNLLAHVLRMQNKLDESDEESKRRLARDPENAFSFANAGWAALQRGDVKGAEAHFKESLRIDPTMEHARDGLKQSYRARSAFFRLFLKWSFFLQRFNQQNRMFIIIGLVVGFRVLRNLAANVHPLLVIPLALAYYLFVFGSWLSSGLANFLLLRDPVARLSLDKSEKLEGAAIGFCFLGGLVATVAGFSLEIHPLAVFGGVLMITALPVSMVFTNPSRIGSMVFGMVSVSLLVMGAMMAFDVAAQPQRVVFGGQAGSLVFPVVLLAAGSTWLGMIPALRNSKPR